MSDKKDGMSAIERLQLRLRGLKGRVVMVYMQIDKDGEPAVIAVQGVGKVEKLSTDKEDGH